MIEPSVGTPGVGGSNVRELGVGDSGPWHPGTSGARQVRQRRRAHGDGDLTGGDLEWRNGLRRGGSGDGPERSDVNRPHHADVVAAQVMQLVERAS